MIARSSTIGLLAALASVSAAEAGAADVCSKSWTGEWSVAADLTPPSQAVDLTAVDRQRLRHATASFSDKNVKFDDKTCAVKTVRARLATQEDLDAHRALQNHALEYDYECEGAVVIPDFFIGNDCNSIIFFVEGVTFELQRARRRQRNPG